MGTLKDSRKAKGIRYQLVDLLTVLILAKLGGEDQMKGMTKWIRLREATLLKLLAIPRKRLSHQTTYERVLSDMDEAELNAMIGVFFAANETDETWQIENRLHYVRDVTFREDACRIRHTKRQRLLASLNNLVIALLRRTAFRYLPEARRYFPLYYHAALQLLL